MIVKKGMIKTGVFAVIAVLVVSTVFIVNFVMAQEDPDLAPFDAEVNIQNAAPTIIAIYNIFDTEGTGTQTDIATAKSGNAADSTNNIRIEFLARDVNGNADLPGGTELITQSLVVGDVGVTAANIEVYVANPGVDYAKTNQLFDAASCSRLATCPNSQAGAGCPANDMEFRCTVPMEYFDEPSGLPTNRWDIFVAVADPTNGIGSLAEGDTFEYTAINDFQITSPVGGLTWSSILLTALDQIDSPGTTQGVTSRGNQDITAGTIAGSNLPPGGGGTGNSIPITSFTLSTLNGIGPPLQQCDGSSHASGAPVTADELTTVAQAIDAGAPVSLLYGRGSSPALNAEQFYYCLWQRLDTLGLTFSESVYSTQAAGGTPWSLVLS